MLLTLPVADVIAATPRALILRLALNGERLPYRAGQAVLVGRSGQDVRRPYSLAIAPHEADARAELELLVGLDAGGGPGAHLAALARGTRVDVEGPVGSLRLPDDPHVTRMLFLAGGTGIAPLRAMLHEALARDRGWQLGVLYSARSPDEFAYGDELQRLATDGAIALRQVVTRPGLRDWTGERGRITGAHVSALADRGTVCFVCGPHAFVAGMLPLLAAAGVPSDLVRVEDWGAG